LIVTVAQLQQILKGALSSVYVPPAHAETWRPRVSYIMLRRFRLIDGERLVSTTEQGVTIVALGEPIAVGAVDQLSAISVGYRTTDEFRTAWQQMYPRTPVAIHVDFALGDWRDRPRFLAPSTGGGDVRGYTSSAGAALDDAECVSDEWLTRFAKAAEPFRDEKLRQRAAAHLNARRLRRVPNTRGER